MFNNIQNKNNSPEFEVRKWVLVINLASVAARIDELDIPWGNYYLAVKYISKIKEV